MEPNSVTFLFIGEAKLSRRDSPQLAAGRVHFAESIDRRDLIPKFKNNNGKGLNDIVSE
jgi:hypothetical protein